MKRFTVLFLVSVMVFSLMGCTEKQPEESTEPLTQSAATTKEETAETASLSSEEGAAEAGSEETEEEPGFPGTESVEPEETKFLGDWYALVKGMTFLLTFSEDGTYAAGFPALAIDPETGTWKLNNGSIVLNDNEEDRILILDEELLQSERLDAMFTREKQEDYTPDEIITDTVLEDFSGYWVSVFVQTPDGIVPAENLGENTDIYIEGSKAALGGDFFGDVIHDFSYEENALVLTLTEAEEPFIVKLELQTDGFMRMTVSSGESEPLVVYLQYEGGEELLTGIPDEEVPSYDDGDEEEQDSEEAEASAAE